MILQKPSFIDTEWSMELIRLNTWSFAWKYANIHKHGIILCIVFNEQKEKRNEKIFKVNMLQFKVSNKIKREYLIYWD